MAENLNYNPGSGSWVYDDDPSLASTYGRLYNWKTACEACPSGWHLPGDEEWKQLEITIGMSQSDADLTTTAGNGRGSNEGLKLKASSGWDTNGKDTYGFKALPGGRLFGSLGFVGGGSSADFWTSSSENNDGNMKYYRCVYDGVIYYLGRSTEIKDLGFSVRCIKD